VPQSRVFTKRPEPPSASVLKEFETFEVAWLADSLGYGLMDGGIAPVWDLQERIVGTAVTVRTPPGDFSLIPWGLNTAREGDILVIDTRGASHRAVWGDQFSGWAKAVGIVAVIIDGATRDTTGIRDLKYPVFARTKTPRGPTMVGAGGDVNVPVVCGGVVVAPGDLVVADREGIVVIASRDLDYALESGRASHDYQVPKQSKETWPAYFEYFKDRGDPVVADTTWDA
jgi:4-hydroxy-4-methyl-2-oxoglutarate aldolase